MEKLFNWTSIALSFICGIAAKLWGGWDMLLYALVTLIVLDYITGVIKALYTRKLSSEIGFKGLCKKVTILLVVALANIVGQLVGDNLAIREIVIMFFIANEGISILENAAVIYPDMPEPLKNVLLQLRNKNDNNEGSEL